MSFFIPIVEDKMNWQKKVIGYDICCAFCRDIKGANLLVDSSGVVKLADFGMAKHVSFQALVNIVFVAFNVFPSIITA